MSFDGKTIELSATVKLLGLTLNKNAIINNICKIFVTKHLTKPELFRKFLCL